MNKAFQPALVGHAQIIDALNEMYKHACIPQALIFSGSKGLGKATLALHFAAFMSDTENYHKDPQHVFTQIQKKSHPRVCLLSTEESGVIDIESVRQAKQFMRLSAAPHWRVLIVDAIDQLNRFGENALLKMIEEPGNRTLIILINHSRARLLPTIRSRAFFMPFHEIANEDLQLYFPHLEEHFWNYVSGNIAIAHDCMNPARQVFYSETMRTFSALIQGHKEELWKYIKTWFAADQKSEWNERFQILHKLFLLFAQKHALSLGADDIAKLWQVNDSFFKNQERYDVFHLDISAILCETLGNLIYQKAS